MQPQNKVVIRRTAVSLPLKLAGIFALAFAFFFILFEAYDLLSSLVERSAASALVAENKTDVVVDPKIVTDLERVLTSNDDTDVSDLKDPFFDRAGLSGAILATPGTVVLPGGGTVVQGTTATVPASGAPAASHGTGSVAANAVAVSAEEATKERYHKWLRNGGTEPLDPRIFSIEDLLPVGLVDGGIGGQQVMFFSQAVGQTVSFPVGTLFFDGWLSELRVEGVVFSSNDERHTARMRSWAHSVKGTS